MFSYCTKSTATKAVLGGLTMNYLVANLVCNMSPEN